MRNNQRSMSNPVRVLVVEDNQDDSDLLVRQLNKNNFAHHVKIIPDGDLAWGFLIANESHIDLIALFLDLNLPSLNGVQLLHRMKSRPSMSHIPVFVMTSSNDPKTLKECERLGVRGCIQKPVTHQDFAKVVANFFHISTHQEPTRSDRSPDAERSVTQNEHGDCLQPALSASFFL